MQKSQFWCHNKKKPEILTMKTASYYSNTKTFFTRINYFSFKEDNTITTMLFGARKQILFFVQFLSNKDKYYFLYY